MDINTINRINELAVGGPSVTRAEGASDAATPFSAFLNAAKSNLEEVNDLTKQADQMSVDFALGRIDNVADVMIAQEKASIALQYTVQLRNSLLDAYNEIMRIQV